MFVHCPIFLEWPSKNSNPRRICRQAFPYVSCVKSLAEEIQMSTCKILVAFEEIITNWWSLSLLPITFGTVHSRSKIMLVDWKRTQNWSTSRGQSSTICSEHPFQYAGKYVECSICAGLQVCRDIKNNYNSFFAYFHPVLWYLLVSCQWDNSNKYPQCTVESRWVELFWLEHCASLELIRWSRHFP